MRRSVELAGFRSAFVGVLFIGCATVAQTAPPDYAAAVLADGPVVYYRFGEAAGAVENLGTYGATHDAVVFGTPQRSVETLNGDAGMYFDSVDDYVESGAEVPGALTGNPSFTAEAVFFLPVGGTAGLWAPFLHWGPSPAGNETAKSVYFSFSNSNPGEVFVGFYNGGLQSPNGTLRQGSWHHILWVRTGGGTDQQGSQLFVNGIDLTASLVPDPELCCNGSTPDVDATTLRVNRARDFYGMRFFTGVVDELALYDRALTPTEVAAHVAGYAVVHGDGFETGTTAAWSTVVP